MEIVWYRMLGPLLGGTTFTFELILAVALLGIGLGGAAYAWFGRNRTCSLNGFAFTCALEAFCLAFPYALGDRLAVMALLLRPLNPLLFSEQVLGWTITTLAVVFPAAFVAGFQFPMLIALLGKGRDDVARHTGLAYAWNTAGCILGVLAGGFGLLPLLSAPGAWRAAVILLVLLAVAAMVMSLGIKFGGRCSVNATAPQGDDDASPSGETTTPSSPCDDASPSGETTTPSSPCDDASPSGETTTPSSPGDDGASPSGTNLSGGRCGACTEQRRSVNATTHPGADGAAPSGKIPPPQAMTEHRPHATRGVWRATILPMSTAIMALLMLFATGPTAFWRHAPIGAGLVDNYVAAPNDLHALIHFARRQIEWEKDGVEGSVALHGNHGLGFTVNGRPDGNAREDAGTHVMIGLLGAILHPRPTDALVVGLGTGTTAGWLAGVPSMERVDVAELEPSLLKVAARCSPVNLNALKNPKVQVWIGDGREALWAAPREYDLIVSAPSHPNRAGVESLFTQEYYRAAARKLRECGLFVHWLQAYDVDSWTMRSVFATLASVFPWVEIWQTQVGDLALVASLKPIAYDANSLRLRLQQEPFKAALMQAWRVTDLEGFLAHYVANDSFAKAVAQSRGVAINSDDHNVLEFAFARGVGRRSGVELRELLEAARFRLENRPRLTGDGVEWASMERQRISLCTLQQWAPVQLPDFTPEQRLRAAPHLSYLKGDFKSLLAAWRLLGTEPGDLVELVMVAEALADAGDEKAQDYIDRLGLFQPAEAAVLLGRLRWRQGRLEEATVALETTFRRYRRDPWPLPHLMDRSLDIALAIARADPGKTMAARLYQAINRPFVVSLLEERRLFTLVQIARNLPPDELNASTLKAIEWYEPHIPWVREFLDLRARCYGQARHPQAPAARRDLEAFDRAERGPSKNR
ncbi:MAG: fused MFS/spermidine synthase [Verrucomicrobia bacterium]|nr:fused MFS/spermidine synthase [Verrucomicrobiota bacterium]